MKNIRGIVLKTIDYKESSKIMYIYTKEGLVSVLIHGSNKMKNRHLNMNRLLNLIDIYVSGKNLLTFRDGDIVKSYQSIADDLEKYTYTTHILELIYSFSSHQHDHEKLFNFLIKIFDIVNESSNYIPYLNMIELKLLYLLGVNPSLKKCVACDKTTNLSFSITEGGLVCPDHLKNPYRISNQAIKLLTRLYYFDLSIDKLEEIELSNIKEIRFLIDKYYEYHLNVKTKSRRLLTGLLGY